MNDHDLWVYQEAVIISAEYHDTAGFTPRFLLSSEIVPKDCIWHQVSRTGEGILLRHDRVHWRMTNNELRITAYPDCSIDDIADGTLVSGLASDYLKAVPYTPVRGLRSLWQIFATYPERDQWMMENFLSKGWPSELGSVVLRPRLTFRLDDLVIQMRVISEGLLWGDEDATDLILFECFVSREGEQNISRAVSDIDSWAPRLRMVEQFIRQLLGSDGR